MIFIKRIELPAMRAE